MPSPKSNISHFYYLLFLFPNFSSFAFSMSALSPRIFEGHAYTTTTELVYLFTYCLSSPPYCLFPQKAQHYQKPGWVTADTILLIRLGGGVTSHFQKQSVFSKKNSRKIGGRSKCAAKNQGGVMASKHMVHHQDRWWAGCSTSRGRRGWCRPASRWRPS